MRNIRRRLLSVLLIAALTMLLAVPAAAAASAQTVTGGTGKSSARVLKASTETSYYTYMCSISSSQRYAYFKFKTHAYDSVYYISMAGREYDVSNSSVRMSKPFSGYLQDANGRNIVSETGTYAFSCATDALKKNSWYYLIFRNVNSASGKIKIQIYGGKDPGGQKASGAQSLTVDKSKYGTICCSSDVDYYKFIPASTGEYRVIVKMVDNWMIGAFLLNNKEQAMYRKGYIVQNDYMTVTRQLTKGKTYYIRVSDLMGEWSFGDSPKKYKVIVQKK